MSGAPGEADKIPEILITREMIEAGAAELARFNPDFQSLEDGAERIYREMVFAAPSREKSAVGPQYTEVDGSPSSCQRK